MKKKLLLLGSTGSIGRQTLSVVDHHQDEFEIEALAAYRSVEAMVAQVARYHPRRVCMVDAQAAQQLAGQVDIPVLSGEAGLLELCNETQADIALDAVVGIAGLTAVMQLIDRGVDIALANKEALVTGGALVMEAVRRKHVKLLPVDSEHSAIFQCLQGGQPPYRLWLTASGGPFYGCSLETLKHVTPQQALRHPNWSMGSKITIDSATLMNKALEVMEARWLFGVPAECIGVLVHRKSIVHSLVEFSDHSILAQLGCPDMRVAIQYALTYPKRIDCPAPVLDLAASGALEFAEPDRKAFPALELGYRALQSGSAAAVALNGSNELAVAAFLAGRIGFLQIPALVERAMDAFEGEQVRHIGDVLELDRRVRAQVEQWL